MEDINKDASESVANSAVSGVSGVVGFLPMLQLGRAQKWVNRIAIGVAAFNLIRGQIKEWKSKQEKTTTLHFKQQDVSYRWVQRWIRALPEARQAFNFEVQAEESSLNATGPVSVGAVVEAGGSKPDVCSLTPATCIEFQWRGHKVRVDTSSTSGTESKDGGSARWMERRITLTIWSQDRIAIDRLVQDIIDKGAVTQKRVPYVMMWSGWNGWQRTRPCPEGRHVILPDGQYQDVLSDVRTFMGRQEWYREVGISWRRGYLLHGIPGSGKTSTVLSVAGDLQMEVCVLTLTDIDNEALLRALSSMPDRSLLVIEDIDAAFRKREGKEASKLTFSELINALDGAATPEGRITFMTTNHRDQLDPALIRPGRVDRQFEFRPALSGQIIELADRFRPGLVDLTTAEAWANEKVSMATVQERLIKLYHQPIHETPVFENIIPFPRPDTCGNIGL